MEAVRQLEQMICKDVRTKPVQHLRNDLRELTNSFGKINLRRLAEDQIVNFRRNLACFTKDRANSDVRILQIRRGVPVQRKHLVPRENVICRPILREIGVFHGTDADLLRDVVLFVLAQARIFFLDDFSGAPARFLDKLAQRNILTRARLHQFAIFSEHTSKYDVAQIGGVTFSPGDRENLLKMQCLRRANDVPDRVRFQLVDTIIDRGEIGRCVIESAVPFANDQGLVSQLQIIVEKHDYGAFADLGYSDLEQAIYHAGQPIVVKAFAALQVVADV